MGYKSEAKQNYAVATGYHAIADGIAAVAMGYDSTATGEAAFAVGRGANAVKAGAVALGSYSVTTNDYDSNGGYAISGKSPGSATPGNPDNITKDYVWKPAGGYGNVAVGDVSAANKITRRITGLAAGYDLTDAVNVAQLYDLRDKIVSSSSDWQLADNDGKINRDGTATAVYKPDENNIVTLNVKNDKDETADPRTYKIDLSKFAGGSYGWNVQTTGNPVPVANTNTVKFEKGNDNIEISDVITNGGVHTVKISAKDTTYTPGDGIDITNNVIKNTRTYKLKQGETTKDGTSTTYRAALYDQANALSGEIQFIDTDTQYKAGNGIDITNNIISSTYSYGWNVQTTGNNKVAVDNADTVKFVAGSDRITISDVDSEAGVHTITIDAAAPAADKYLKGVNVDADGTITFTMSDDTTHKLNLTSKNSSVAITGTPKTESADPSIDFSAKGGGGGSDVNIEGGDHIHVKNEGDTYTITGDETKLKDGKNTKVNSTSATDPDTGKVTTTWTVDGWKTEVKEGSNNIVVTPKSGDNDQHLKYEVDLAPDITINSATVKQQITVGGDTNQTIITGDSVKTTNVTTTEITLGEGEKTTNITYDGDRITYDKKEIANLQDDGLTFEGDTGSADVKLDKVTKIYGGATDVSSSNNITVEAKSDGSDGAELKINLAKNIKIDNSIKVGDTTNITGDTITTTNIEGDTVKTQKINLGDTTITEGDDNRITYNTKSGDTYNIATLKDGMDFAGDDGKAIHKNLAEQLDVVGGAAEKASKDNIYTYNDNGKIHINLAKDIEGVDTVTVNKTINVGGNTTITGDTITTRIVNVGDTTINNNGVTIKNGPSITKNGVDAGGKKITNVAPGTDGTDAVNVDQLNSAISQVGGDAINRLGDQMNRLDNSTRKGIAGAAALAALHPLDFDPDDKWEFSAGVGNYRGETAAAIGAFYHPNDDTIFSLGATVGNGENLVNGGVTFRFGQQNHQSRSKKAMAKEIVELRAEVAELKAMVYSMANGRMPGLDLTKSEEFPDTPENHWAYDYVSVLAGNGVLEGYQDGFFKGDRTLTRYEMAAIIYRAMMRGVDVDERMKEEFAPELARVKVDTLTSHSDGTPSIQRVRVIKGRE